MRLVARGRGHEEGIPASLCLTAPRRLAYTAALSYAKEGAQ